MAPPQIPPPHSPDHERLFSRTRVALLTLATLGLVSCLALAWLTRDAMRKLPSAPGSAKRTRGPRTIVDLSPWQSAEALAQLAVTAEEKQYAQQAERLADHSVDQAFAAALREANLQAQHRPLTGASQQIAQKITQLQQLVAQDQAVVKQLSSPQVPSKSSSAPAIATGLDLEIAKAQAQLDLDELADAQEDLQRASGDTRPQIQSELTAHQAAMQKYDSQSGEPGQFAVTSAGRYGTLAGRVGAWFRQRTRIQLINQAGQEAEAAVKSLTAMHNALAASADSNPPATDGQQDSAARLAALQDRSAKRQLLSIYDDRIQTEQQLAGVYQKWSAQVQSQGKILAHLLLNSLAWVFAIVLCMIVANAVIRRLMRYPVLDPRQRHTLRSILQLCVQLVGAGCILLVIFGPPQQTATMLGLGTAALTIALQDFILAFLGWFILIGNRGMRVGDSVEIDGIGGEVIEIGLLSTMLLETGTLANNGYPTGRRITLMNGFAIRGKYFNFSTAGQWMLDQFDVAVSTSENVPLMVDQILKALEEETGENTRLAEKEWSRSLRGQALSQLRSLPSVNLKPSGGSFDLAVRYVARASDRFDTKNRLYRRVIALLTQTSPA